MKITSEQRALSFFLPKDTLKYFNVVSSQMNDKTLHIILEEKNDPPLEERHSGLTVKSLDFQDITIRDFPVRGRETLLTFKRRRWRVGDSEILRRAINLRAPGTRLEEEFGLFLKADS